MADRVLYEGMVHWAHQVKLVIDWKTGYSTLESFVRLLCTGLLDPEKPLFVHDDVDCMTCLVTRAREGEVYVRF